MKIDLHVHIADIDGLLADTEKGRLSKSSGYLKRMLRFARANHSASASAAEGLNKRWLQRLSQWVRESPLDAVVLLALDAVYDERGQLRPDKTVLQVENDFVWMAARSNPEFLFGASVHPYRRDAIAELERVVDNGACLIKWIPSAQHIQPDSPRCYPFYEAMAHHGLPLLCHTGVEHMLGFRRFGFNHPKRLIPALQRGVTVIAAHCGARLFLHEPSFVGSWASLAREHENFYGDTGAFSIVTRIPCLTRILGDPALRSKLLYGSDYPGIPSPRWCWQLGLRKMGELSLIDNPLTRNMRLMQALNTPTEVFERAHTHLGLHKEINPHDG